MISLQRLEEGRGAIREYEGDLTSDQQRFGLRLTSMFVEFLRWACDCIEDSGLSEARLEYSEREAQGLTF